VVGCGASGAGACSTTAAAAAGAGVVGGGASGASSSPAARTGASRDRDSNASRTRADAARDEAGEPAYSSTGVAADLRVFDSGGGVAEAGAAVVCGAISSEMTGAGGRRAAHSWGSF